MKISVIGSGNVGQRIGKDFLERGNEVIFYDVINYVLDELRHEGYNATDNVYDALNNSEVSFITVGTPLSNLPNKKNEFDYTSLRMAVRDLAVGLKKKDEYHLFVLKSTVTPGTTENELVYPLGLCPEKKIGVDYGVAYNPEFLTVIESTWTDDPNFTITPENEGRIVIGVGDDERAIGILKELYSPSPIHITDYKTAEMTKLVANSRLPLVISFSNEIFQYCEKLKEEGINVDTDFVIDMVHKDPRIGSYGSKFGKAYGGPCFKKDPVAFQAFLEKTLGEAPSLLKDTIKINEEMKKHGVRE